MAGGVQLIENHLEFEFDGQQRQSKDGQRETGRGSATANYNRANSQTRFNNT